MGRYGTTSIDNVISFVLFLGIVTIIMFYAVELSDSNHIGLSDDYVSLWGRYMEPQDSFNLYIVPVYVTSIKTIANYAINITSNYNTDFNPDSITVFDSNWVEVPSIYNTSLFFSSNLTSGNNLFYIGYSTDFRFTELSMLTDITFSESWINNSKISLNFTQSGMSSMIFNGSEFLTTGIYFDNTSSFYMENLSVLHSVFFENLTVRMYPNTSRIFVETNIPKTIIFNITDVFDRFYNGSVNQFNESLYELFTFNTGFLDMYSTTNSNGIALMGDNMSIIIENHISPAQKTIYLSGVSFFEVYLHNSDYLQALDELDIFFTPPTIMLGSTELLKDITNNLFIDYRYNDTNNNTLFGIPKIDSFMARIDLE
ncbi:MAG: hypothetical protein K0B02_00955 [DPANN group archaeon]|nr:hypothetical protein [DPANN group archaeon]